MRRRWRKFWLGRWESLNFCFGCLLSKGVKVLLKFCVKYHDFQKSKLINIFVFVFLLWNSHRISYNICQSHKKEHLSSLVCFSPLSLYHFDKKNKFTVTTDTLHLRAPNQKKRVTRNRLYLFKKTVESVYRLKNNQQTIQFCYHDKYQKKLTSTVFKL